MCRAPDAITGDFYVNEENERETRTRLNRHARINELIYKSSRARGTEYERANGARRREKGREREREGSRTRYFALPQDASAILASRVLYRNSYTQLFIGSLRESMRVFSINLECRRDSVRFPSKISLLHRVVLIDLAGDNGDTDKTNSSASAVALGELCMGKCALRETLESIRRNQVISLD